MPPRSKSKKTSALPDMSKFDEKFEKTFGEGTLSSGEQPREVISTGSIKLDYALGVGGYVEGRLYEIWGIGGIGKTTFVLLGVVEAQKKHPDKYVAWIDVEQTYDAAWAKTLGVDLSRLRVYSPDSAEDVADAAKEFIRSGYFSMVVLDSIGAMISKAEKEKDAEEVTVANVPKVVTRMVNIAASECRRTKTVFIIINQVRANIAKFGPTTQTNGGWALRHVTTGKLQFKSSGTTALTVNLDADNKNIPVGREIVMKVERNKCAPAFRTAPVMMLFEATEKYGPVGVDKADEAVTVGMKCGAIVQGGAWYTVASTGERINGRDKLIAALREQPDTIEAIRQAAIASLSDEVLSEEEEDWSETEAVVPVDALPGSFDFRTGTEGLDE